MRSTGTTDERKFGYADPPYFGQGKKHYSDHPEHAEYDTIDGHRRLVERLEAEYPDGWAMSLHTPSLGEILAICPDDVRVGAWVKTFAAFKANVNPGYCWEPVIFRGGRKRSRQWPTVRDWVAAPITLKKGTSGAKPPQFTLWVLSLLGAEPQDQIDDLFPGSGMVQSAIDEWRQNPRTFLQKVQPVDVSQPFPSAEDDVA